MSLSDMVNYWFEYVLIHKETSHFQSKALRLAWYQYWLVDVMALVFILIIVIVYALFIFYIRIKNYVRTKFDDKYQKKNQMMTDIHISNRKTSAKRTLSHNFKKTVDQQQVVLQPKKKL